MDYSKMQLSSSIILLSLAFASIVCEAYAQDAEARITQYENENNGLGEYKFNFQTSNNIERSESGKLEEDGNFVVRGFYSFVSADGKKYFVNYVADKSGYHPTVISEDSPKLEYTPQEPQGFPPITVVSSPPGNIVASLLG